MGHGYEARAMDRMCNGIPVTLSVIWMHLWRMQLLDTPAIEAIFPSAYLLSLIYGRLLLGCLECRVS